MSNVPPPGQPDGYGGPPPYPGAGSPPGYQPYGAPGFQQGVQSNGRATASMVCGILGLVAVVVCGFFTLVLSPLAFFLGRSAQKEIDASPGVFSNGGQAKAGWIMGLIGIILILIGIAAIAVIAATGQFDTT